MDYSSVSNEPHYLDSDTEDALVKYQPIFSEYTILAEYNAVREQYKVLQDVYVIPSAKDPYHWFGVIFMKHGPYKEAIFRFNIHIGKNFPRTEIPTIVFTPPIFHPKVDPISGFMETKSSFGQWQCGVHHIWHLLLYIKRSLLIIDDRNPVNQIASELSVHDPVEFNSKIAECIQDSKLHLHESNQFSSDPHYLRFSPYNPNIHGTFRKAILARKTPFNTSEPLSWVKAGTLEPCTLTN